MCSSCRAHGGRIAALENPETRVTVRVSACACGTGAPGPEPATPGFGDGRLPVHPSGFSRARAPARATIAPVGVDVGLEGDVSPAGPGRPGRARAGGVAS